MQLTVFNPIQDVYISSAYPDQNFANHTQGDVLFIGSFSSATAVYRSLLQFDVVDANRGIPPNSTIINATLNLFYYRNDNVGTAEINGYRLLNYFNQNTVSYNTAPLSSFPVAIFSEVLTLVSDLVDIDITVLVQGWYSGSIPNTGIELRGLENANNNLVGFRSTRYENPISWSFLEVTWNKGA